MKITEGKYLKYKKQFPVQVKNVDTNKFTLECLTMPPTLFWDNISNIRDYEPMKKKEIMYWELKRV